MYHNSTISLVSLQGNKVDDEIMQTLGEYIQKNKSIECVNLVSNKITDEGVRVLTDYFDGNTSMKNLALANNLGISIYALANITKMIQTSRLEEFDCYGTSIEYENPFIAALMTNRMKAGSFRFQMFEK